MLNTGALPLNKNRNQRRSEKIIIPQKKLGGRWSNKANPDSVLGLRVVHDAKYDANKNDNPENIRSANVADEILSVLNKFNGNPYIREVIATNPQKPPAVICYTDEQLKLMKNAIVMGASLVWIELSM